MTALMLASSKGHLDAVQALQRGGADLNKEHPVSVLHVPQRPNIIPCMNNCMVVCVQESGWTALFFAAKAGKSDVFRELVCRGAVTETSSVSLKFLWRVINNNSIT